MNQGPDFIVVGAMKSATTTLHAQLNRQAGVFMSNPKEPNFFSNDEVYARGLDWYCSLFSTAKPTDLRGESSTHYTKLPTYPDAVPRMRAAFPRLKLIYVIRHPIDRLISQYTHESIQGSMRPPVDLAIDRHPRLIDYSRYSMQIEPYLDAYGPENVLVAFAERLAWEPQEELERICRFLGFQSRPTWDVKFNRQNARTQRLRRSAVRNILVAAPVLTTIRQRYVPRSWQDRLKRVWRVPPAPKPRLSEAATDRLREIFDADLGRLGRWMGAELSCDGYNDAVLGVQSKDWSWARPIP